ncbi:MAG: hypothetical protein D6766_07230 [Verrucomicrobia bacterium]|nr:MAG: hypothetical protein D6766_07230 [Verrucomicrobiota bacterium]
MRITSWRSGCWLAGAVALLLAAAPGSVWAQDTDEAAGDEPDVIEDGECLDCHGDRELTKTGPDGREVSLYVDEARFGESVHGGMVGCVDCHADLTREHPDNEAPTKPVDCAACHEEEGEQYASSIHGVSQRLGPSAAAQCWDCHGHHDIRPARDPASPVFKLNLPATCGRCHADRELAAAYRIPGDLPPAHFQDSIHGHALLDMGLLVAPSCNDCHGVHDIKRRVDRESPIHPSRIPQTCGRCHLKVQQTFDQSVHARVRVEGEDRAPVCTDCHTAHDIERPENGHFKQISDRRCGACHQDRLARYEETYHGKAMALGRANRAPEVAACYDCHGHHDVLPVSDPNSKLSSENILATCRRCHPQATAGFTRYQPHADPHDGENYPALHLAFVGMTSLLLAVFAFFGAHTLLWLGRSLVEYRHDSKSFREAKRAARRSRQWFSRFRPFDRFLHLLVVTSFLLLVATGMPLKFHGAPWAQVLLDLLGGTEVARWLHRVGALVTFLYFGLHLVSLAVKAWRGRGRLRNPETGRFEWRRLGTVLFGPDSLIPTWQDWRDFVAHVRWFLGRGPRPQFDRWTYWEKFDYFAVFWGVAIIGFSGLIMWFPEWFTRHLPGWVINVALVVHSDEALLAAGFIFAVHFFNTHFRPERFPMDPVIFSGRVSKEEMLHERRRWYERLEAEGRLKLEDESEEWRGWAGIARALGFLFLGVGLVLLALIVYALVNYWLS